MKDSTLRTHNHLFFCSFNSVMNQIMIDRKTQALKIKDLLFSSLVKSPDYALSGS